MKKIEEYRKQFGKNLRRYRLQKNMTLDELGIKSGLNFKYIGGVERGAYNISFDNIIKIAQALEIEPYKLLIFPDTPKSSAYFSEILALISNEETERLEFYYKILALLKNFQKENQS